MPENHKTTRPYTGVLASVICLALERKAHAYIDPGTGSIIFQLIIAGLLGASFAVKIHWRKIIAFFRDKFSKENPEENAVD